MIDPSKMISVEEISSETVDQSDHVELLWEQADNYLKIQPWFSRLLGAHLAWGFGKLAIFLAAFETSSRTTADAWLIIGDVPPAVISTELCPTVFDALDGYLGEVSAWVDAVLAGQEVDGLMPILDQHTLERVPPIPHNARLIENRMEFVAENILEPYREELMRNAYVKDNLLQESNSEI